MEETQITMVVVVEVVLHKTDRTHRLVIVVVTVVMEKHLLFQA